MLFSPRITNKQLAGLCRRLAVSLGAGIDIRKTWLREIERPIGRRSSAIFKSIGAAINQGEGLSKVLSETGDYFPPLFLELVEVGETTGHVVEVFAQLADHYESQVKRQREFLSSITLPMVQLTAALFVVGIIIWVMGLITDTTGSKVDILGFGLVGTPGLIAYVGALSIVSVTVAILISAIRRGVGWTKAVQRLLLRVPLLGNTLETLALARLSWAMCLTMKTGMDVRQALELSLWSTLNARYTDQIQPIGEEISTGTSIYEAFVETGQFPAEFLDVLHVGEQSGQLAESMERLSIQFQDRARSAIATLTTLAGFAVWAIIAVLIVVLIFRVFSFYLGAINSAAGI